jgi:hypothetical protein
MTNRLPLAFVIVFMSPLCARGACLSDLTTIHHGGHGGQEEKSRGFSPFEQARRTLSSVEGAGLDLRVLRVLCGSSPRGSSLAQVSTVTLQGTVKDQTGAALPGATVTVVHTGTGASRTLVTDAGGRYVAAQLAIGGYDLRGELQGFRTEVRRGITLTVGVQAVVDLVLSVGSLQEVIEVTGEAPRVQTTSSTVSGLVDSKTMRELPLNGRNFVQLATLQVGVVNSDRVRGGFPLSSGTGMKFNVNGARDNSNSFLLDGQDIQDVFNSTPASGGGETLGVDTLAEFEVKTANFSAEYGKAAGAVINAVTKSGANSVHGSAFEFLRNDRLDAANFFDNAFGNPKPAFSRNQFGATMGGAVVRNRTFYFGGYEGIREARGFTRQFIGPSNDARQGRLRNPSTGRMEQLAISPAVQPYLDLLFLTPNGRDFGDGRAERIETRTTVKDDDFFVVKVDQRLSGSNAFFVRYSFDDGRLNTPGGPVFGRATPTRNQFFAIQQNTTLSRAVVATFRFGVNRSTIAERDVPLVQIPENLFFVPSSRLPGILTVSGWTAPGNSNLAPRQFAQSVYELGNTTVVSPGAHLIKFGGSVQRYQAFFDQSTARPGVFSFSSIRNFLEGRAASFQGPNEPIDTVRDMRQDLFGFFVQDDIRARPRFTLNLGLRYEFITVPTEVHGKIANLRSMDAAKVTVGEPFFNNPSLQNVAPRAGFAWDVLGDSKLSLRSGFGVFHSEILPNVYRQISLSNAPFSGNRFQLNPPFPGAQATAPPQQSGNASSFPFDPKQPVAYQWNLTVQRQLPAGIVTSVGYVGTRGVHLPWGISGQDRNLAVPTIVDGRKFFAPNSPRANPAFAVLTTVRFDANSFYNGFQFGVRRQSVKGLQFQTSYTFSKSIDEASGIFGAAGDFAGSPSPPDPLDPRSERGPSAFDARHTFVTNLLYPLPIHIGSSRGLALLLDGWQLNGIVNLSSGLPFTVLVDGPSDRDRDLAQTAIRPDLVPGRSDNPIVGDPQRWFDPTAFALPPPGYYGTLGRNTLRADSFQNLDMGLQKNFVARAGFTMQFRTEVFNVLNHANFQIPAVTTIFVSDSPTPVANAGQVTSTANPARQIQLSLKLIW